MNKRLNFKNTPLVADNSVVAAFGLFTGFVPALYLGKPAAWLNSLWISPIP